MEDPAAAVARLLAELRSGAPARAAGDHLATAAVGGRCRDQFGASEGPASSAAPARDTAAVCEPPAAQPLPRAAQLRRSGEDLLARADELIARQARFRERMEASGRSLDAPSSLLPPGTPSTCTPEDGRSSLTGLEFDAATEEDRASEAEGGEDVVGAASLGEVDPRSSADARAAASADAVHLGAAGAAAAAPALPSTATPDGECSPEEEDERKALMVRLLAQMRGGSGSSAETSTVAPATSSAPSAQAPFDPVSAWLPPPPFGSMARKGGFGGGNGAEAAASAAAAAADSDPVAQWLPPPPSGSSSRGAGSGGNNGTTSAARFAAAPSALAPADPVAEWLPPPPFGSRLRT
eukprot:TRINITY_DN18026_c0_g1_i1.p1 TRINITY_DN18026_c0_g1~~TRINITY_DN18026_c0_g1_i1.p1  ORF type:complete len:375 (-),score=97.45 TRINITY_DN18026_c0_g1_i1:184-1239(-)